jgi:hypothetical protein
VLGLLVIAGLLTSCGEAQESAVESVAADFLGAVQEHDGARACGLLSRAAFSEVEESSGQQCAQAILEEDIQIGRVDKVSVFETMAYVRLGDQALFLSDFDTGWLVTAAACSPVPNHPYDCSIQGS